MGGRHGLPAASRRLVRPIALALSALSAVTASMSLSMSTPASGAPPLLGGTPVAAGAPAVLPTMAQSVSDPLSAPEGPGVVVPPSGTAPAGSLGEGIVWLTMGADGTSWRSATMTAVTVDVQVDNGPAQQIVLFDGATPFTYTGFTGPLTVGPHTVRVTDDRTLSRTVFPVTVRLLHLTLGVLAPTDAQYDEVAYAPVLYGRHAAGRAYTPLLTDAATTSGSDGSQQLAYVLVISAHDQGDSIVPAYQWGLWGRMTDIVSILNQTVSAAGAVSEATYASCGCENIPFFPDWLEAPKETTAPVESTPFGTHPVLRDASATNYLSDKGTSPYRFQQLPVAAPPAGQLRDAVMDEHPWTYEVSNEELPREHVISTNPGNLLVGDYRQYAIVESNLDVTGTQSVEFAIRLSGSNIWYSTDYEQMTLEQPIGFPFNNGGLTRSAIKLPVDWEFRTITGFQIRLETAPGSKTTPTLSIDELKVLAVTPDWQVVSVALPAIGIVDATALEPIGLPS
jgi:hypothetical protein